MDVDLSNKLVALAGHSLMLMLMLSAPAVLVALAVGFLISIFQAVTQIQEQTLTFVPKIIAVIMVLLFTGGWMVNEISSYAQQTLHDVAQDVRR